MPGFIAELKRRNVFKVALVYVIAGWLTMQVVDVMFPALQLPDWLTSAVAAFLIIGFPFALIFAWAFEMTPEGIKRERPGAAWEAAVAAYEERYGFGNSYQMAEIYADAGDLDMTFEWLGHTARVRDPGAPWAMIMPFFEEAWRDPRFDEYRARFGL